MKFFIMDNTGHSTMEFTAEQKAEANKVFEKLLADGHTAATRQAGAGDYTVIRHPDNVQDETLFIPQRKGG